MSAIKEVVCVKDGKLSFGKGARGEEEEGMKGQGGERDKVRGREGEGRWRGMGRGRGGQELGEDDELQYHSCLI